MEKIIINNEEVFLKKDWTGYRVVEPIFHPETKKFIPKNFFSKKGFLTLSFILLIILFGYLAFNEQLLNYKEVLSNPCKFCSDCFTHGGEINDNWNTIHLTP